MISASPLHKFISENFSLNSNEKELDSLGKFSFRPALVRNEHKNESVLNGRFEEYM